MAVLTFDQVHSGIAFQVKHMMVSKTKGEFTSFDVEIDGDINQLEAAKWTVSIDTASIDTNNEDRDNHLRSGDFFNAEQHPKITFISDTIQKISENEYEVTGQLTLKVLQIQKHLPLNITEHQKAHWMAAQLPVLMQKAK